MKRIWLVAAAGVLLWGQAGRDFLTPDEVGQISETAQDPVARLKLYCMFARVRMDMIKQSLEKEKPGRSRFIHDTIEDFTKIIETIDTVTDDALKRGKDLSEVLPEVAKVGKELLEDLEKIDESAPSDLARYKFVLTTAIDTTRDSIELAEKDAGERAREAKIRDAEDKKAREALMSPVDVKARRDASQRAAEEESKQKKKAPTLRRKGETPAKK
ncbi:MAG: hypothetical protein FJW39_04745 [Acidobacteria bacterium]|nr:hypothetical protein [Acidobacteriota bacterium]